MRTSNRIIGLAAVLALGVTASACGSGSGGGSGGKRVASLAAHTTTTTATGSKGDKKSFEDAMLEYARCMRQHGVDMPDPTFTDNGSGGMGMTIQQRGTGGGGGAGPKDDATFKAASTACQPIMDRAQQYAPRPSPEEEAKMRDQALAFARCMRAHGIDMPDPTFDANGGSKIEMHSEGSGSSNGSSANSGPPKMDPKFEAASKACSKDGGPGIMTKTAGA